MPHALAFVERRVEAALDQIGVGRFTSTARAVRAVEFGAVGATGTAVNTTVFVLSPVAYLLAGVLAFVSGTVWTFALNWTVTYDRPGSLIHSFGRYAAVYVVGLLVYTAALAVGVELLGLVAVAANLFAIAVAGVVNFLGSELFALAG